ncbi:hypothetical protein CK220_15925 [Mesorhizobium sp. WSM3860]|nr:hypothetical protein CK220_15925 [Mesorhizobium sp. WSM3860]
MGPFCYLSIRFGHGHFSPYRDGEKGACAEAFANFQRCRKGADDRDSPLLPVSRRGEGAGRRMRGSAIAIFVIASVGILTPP